MADTIVNKFPWSIYLLNFGRVSGLLQQIRLLFLGVWQFLYVLFGRRLSLALAIAAKLNAVVRVNTILDLLTLFFLVAVIFKFHQERRRLKDFFALSTESILKFLFFSLKKHISLPGLLLLF